MKKLLLITALLFVSSAYSQSIRNFQKKNEKNQSERTQMLDLLRNDIKNDIEQDVVFVVDHFLVSDKYAWMTGTIQRKDGREVNINTNQRSCCNVEALFKKVNGQWVLKENGAFATDVWYQCLKGRYPDVNLDIFNYNLLDVINCND